MGQEWAIFQLKYSLLVNYLFPAVISKSDFTTGWTKDRRNSNLPLFSSVGWAIQLIFGEFKVQMGRFNYMYRTSGLVPICLLEVWLKLEFVWKCRFQLLSLLPFLYNLLFPFFPPPLTQTLSVTRRVQSGSGHTPFWSLPPYIDGVMACPARIFT